MQCPFCQHPDNRVLESRSTEAGQSIRRRRECLNCQRRFTTYERIEFVPVTVLKQDGQRESFDRSKLLRGIVRACQKTGIPAARLEALVDEIESELQHRAMREVSSYEIGELVLQQLKQSGSEWEYFFFDDPQPLTVISGCRAICRRPFIRIVGQLRQRINMFAAASGAVKVIQV